MRRYPTFLLVVALCVTVGSVGCSRHRVHKTPPAKMLMEPGPGVGGPGPGVVMSGYPMPVPQMASQLAFVAPQGMWVRPWMGAGDGMVETEPLVAPGRQNVLQGGFYRYKLTNIPGRPGVELYPSLEIGPATPRTEAYLSHNAIPIQLNEQDLDQILSGNFITKVIYLPDPEFQTGLDGGIDTLVSSRLNAGVDPIVEADRRGSILCIMRVGNIDPELPGMPGELNMGDMGGVSPASFNQAMPGAPIAMGSPGVYGGPGFAPSLVAGVTGPQYGMPITGTPIGLPGPPHVPLGVPAGLQRHAIRNGTHVCMPDPPKKIHMRVKQKPGYSYPKPVNRVNLVESNRASGQGSFKQPLVDIFNWMKN
ncbi:MAG: hypothetical protein DWQ31_07620 [Planctomycetota bacterium]|nr:MAG: hypothetical protein DWQ31_07620 [Planctomycetota bacterium]REJ89580.1 MAG: hypothetical protein DWQ35_17995 [Planctomycetota bacterium]REK31443.1 MAG: hypothetical protein DWQ42_00505 [Planctomycetota bacterium]REK40673.1 MAG: hypothetical protein DWQ46_15645 [Planctomycetota bacterium]